MDIDLKDHRLTGRWNVCGVLYFVPQKGMKQLVKHIVVSEISLVVGRLSAKQKIIGSIPIFQFRMQRLDRYEAKMA